MDLDGDGYLNDEVELPAELVSIDETLNGNEEVRFTLPNVPEYADVIKLEDRDVIIYYDSTAVWFGRMTGGDFTDDSITVICRNKVWEEMQRILFGDPLVTDPYLGTPEGDFSAGAADWEIMYGIIQKDEHYPEWAHGFTEFNTQPQTTIKVIFDKASCYDAIWYISQCINLDFWTGNLNARGTNWNRINFGVRNSAPGAWLNPIHIPKRIFDNGDPSLSVTAGSVSISNNTIDRSLKRTYAAVISYDNAGIRLIGEAGSGYHQIAYREGAGSGVDLAGLNNMAAKGISTLSGDSIGTSVNVLPEDGFNVYPGDYIAFKNAQTELGFLEYVVGDNTTVYRVIKTHKRYDSCEFEIVRSYSNVSEILKSLESLASMGIYPVGGAAAASDWVSNIKFIPYGSNEGDKAIAWGSPPYTADGDTAHDADLWVDSVRYVIPQGNTGIALKNKPPYAGAVIYYLYINIADSPIVMYCVPKTLYVAVTGDLVLATAELDYEETTIIIMNPGSIATISYNNKYVAVQDATTQSPDGTATISDDLIVNFSNGRFIVPILDSDPVSPKNGEVWMVDA